MTATTSSTTTTRIYVSTFTSSSSSSQPSSASTPLAKRRHRHRHRHRQHQHRGSIVIVVPSVFFVVPSARAVTADPRRTTFVRLNEPVVIAPIVIVIAIVVVVERERAVRAHATRCDARQPRSTRSLFVGRCPPSRASTTSRDWAKDPLCVGSSTGSDGCLSTVFFISFFIILLPIEISSTRARGRRTPSMEGRGRGVENESTPTATATERPDRSRAGGARRASNVVKKKAASADGRHPFYSRAMTAPTAASLALISSASSFLTSFFNTAGAPSTSSFASLSPRSVTPRTSLMTLIF